ncbi:sulfate transporter N-terminal domain with GLY motif-domain-containing protein [Dichotomocladium elegans]|nr:sulfate transporter N-terminal domain with GLY motif-domain-containing protein [Dichotomocladium elegans]
MLPPGFKEANLRRKPARHFMQPYLVLITHSPPLLSFLHSVSIFYTCTLTNMRWASSSNAYLPIPLQPAEQEHTDRRVTRAWSFLLSVFPIMRWIHLYNTAWFIQDMIAGITVGVVSVPQSIAYARLANLAPQYGLYTAFIGSTVYCLFGTSKDINIGPITTVSLLVGQAVSHIHTINPSIPASEVGAMLAMFCGLIITFIGIIRLGFLVNFIPGKSTSRKDE